MENVDFMQVLTQVLTSVLIAVISWGALWLSNAVKGWSTGLNAKAQEQKDKATAEKLQKYIGFAENIILDVVKQLNETTVKDLKAASADGRLTKDDAQNILKSAIQTVMLSLSPNIQNVISEVYGDIETWVETKVELDVKAEKPALMEEVMQKKWENVTISTVNTEGMPEDTEINVDDTAVQEGATQEQPVADDDDETAGFVAAEDVETDGADDDDNVETDGQD
jgi:hypothetical protein